jgi:hypothetical protein
MRIRRIYIIQILLLLSLAAILQVSQNDSQAACTPAPSGLVSWWKGEGTGLDQTLANNGTLNNEATYIAGSSLQAFSFDCVRAWLTAPKFGIPTESSNKTMMMWVYINQFNSGESYFARYGTG